MPMRPEAPAETPPEARSGVLLVEDEVKVARFISQGLTEEGYAVDVASTFSDGEARLRAGAAGDKYALLILDWMLPDGDGLLLAKRCRAQGYLLPILMLTARDAISERVDALDSGVDDYLVKPFAFAELLARVRALLRRSRGRVAMVRVGDIEIDPVARVVRRAGAVVPLTAREFAVLSYLAGHLGRPVSRSELLEQVWATSHDTPVTANVVDAQITRLRDKLEQKGAPPLISTVRRVGYCLGAPAEGKDKE